MEIFWKSQRAYNEDHQDISYFIYEKCSLLIQYIDVIIK